MSALPPYINIKGKNTLRHDPATVHIKSQVHIFMAFRGTLFELPGR